MEKYIADACVECVHEQEVLIRKSQAAIDTIKQRQLVAQRIFKPSWDTDAIDQIFINAGCSPTLPSLRLDHGTYLTASWQLCYDCFVWVYPVYDNLCVVDCSLLQPVTIDIDDTKGIHAEVCKRLQNILDTMDNCGRPKQRLQCS